METLTISRDQFEFLLAGIESNYALAFEAAKGLNANRLTATARDIARQRRMNQMVENGIIQLEELTNITVAVSREETIGRIPFPPHIDRRLTLINFENQR